MLGTWGDVARGQTAVQSTGNTQGCSPGQAGEHRGDSQHSSLPCGTDNPWDRLPKASGWVQGAPGSVPTSLTRCVCTHRYLGLQFFFEVGAFLCFGAVYLILSKQERETRQAQQTKAEPEKEKLAGNSIKSPESKV